MTRLNKSKPSAEIVKAALDILTLNEIGHDHSLAYRFSDPDGLQTGKSGFSFGRVQFDIKNNKQAILHLRACGFTEEDVVRLLEQSGPIDDLNAKLLAASDMVDRFDLEHTRESVEHCMDLLAADDILVASEETILHIVDYHNQFYMSPGGKIHRRLRELKQKNMAIAPGHVLDFKLNNTKWGRERPDDVRRRFKNIEDFCMTNDVFKIKEA